MVWAFWTIAGIASLYGLHRLGLWMEEKGYIYYLHKKSSGSAAGSFVAMQRILEPKSQIVEQIQHGEEREEGDEATGSGDRPRVPLRIPSGKFKKT